MYLRDLYKKSVSKLALAGIKNSELDIRVLLETVIKKDSTFFVNHPLEPLTNYQAQKFKKMLQKREKNIPLAYILGEKEFFGLNFKVNHSVLIPRPESEFLVERTIKFIKLKVHKVHKVSILDAGTGSGCIIISLAKQLNDLPVRSSTPTFDKDSGRGEQCRIASLRLEEQAGETIEQLNFYASDISAKALNVARKNAKRLLFERERELDNLVSSRPSASNNKIRFYLSDLFSNKRMPKKYDIIIANLPYVPKDNRTIEQLNNEPFGAIFADDNGTAIIKKFLTEAPLHIHDHGLILIELDPRNAEELLKYTQSLFKKTIITLLKDLTGHNRYLEIKT